MFASRISVNPAKIEARTVGLHYQSDQIPGIRRVGTSPSFHYLDVHGKRIKDKTILARIAGLTLPPAWTGVWIAASATAHLQATGRDA
jgi:DNA topoisomerase-1